MFFVSSAPQAFDPQSNFLDNPTCPEKIYCFARFEAVNLSDRKLKKRLPEIIVSA
jgi:hypothetical protein